VNARWTAAGRRRARTPGKSDGLDARAVALVVWREAGTLPAVRRLVRYDPGARKVVRRDLRAEDPYVARLFELGFAGMKDKDGRFLFEVKDKDGKPVPLWDFAHYYDVNVDEHLFDEYRKTTRLKHKDLAPYTEYVKARGLRWPVVQQQDGSWRETKFRFSGFDDPYVKKGRDIQFYHSTTHDDRAQIWFSPYEPPPESPDADFPFWLCTGRVIEHWHSGTMTMRIPQLQRAMPQAYVEMNRADARRLGVANGDWVTLETRRGKLELPVWIGGRGEPVEGSLFVPFFDERLLINGLTLDEHDPFSKQPDYKKCAARVRRRELVAEKQG